MKAVLVSEHENEAKAFIRDVETQYLPLVRIIISEIKALGLTPTEHHIRSVLTDGPQVLSGNYEAYASRDVTSGSSVHVKRHMKALHDNVFAQFIANVTPRLDLTIGGKSVNHPLFNDLISFDETGAPFLSDEGREKISNQYKEYISDPKLLKVRDAYAGAAASLQALWQALQASGMAKAMGIDYSESEDAGWTFERLVLRVLCEQLTITGRKGKYVIEPRQLTYKNFQPLTTENDGE